MPSLARKILIIAAIDGLILSPVGLPTSHHQHHHHHQASAWPRSPPPHARPEGGVIIDYKDKQLSPYHAPAHARVDGTTSEPKGEAAAGEEKAQLEAHGIVGTYARCYLPPPPPAPFTKALTMALENRPAEAVLVKHIPDRDYGCTARGYHAGPVPHLHGDQCGADPAVIARGRGGCHGLGPGAGARQRPPPPVR